MTARQRSFERDSALFFAALAALAALTLVLGSGWWYATNRVLDPRLERALQFSRAVSESHQAMLDQETGLRGYAASGREVFLEPYRAGVTTWTRASGRAWALAPSAALEEQLGATQGAAAVWQSEFAIPLLARTTPGTPAAPRSLDWALGKERFDAYREPHAALRTASDAYQARVLDQRRAADLVSSGLIVVLALLGLALAQWRRRRIRQDVGQPIRELLDVLDRLSHGRADVRPGVYRTQEMAALAAGVTTLADAVQERDVALRAQQDQERRRAEVFERVMLAAHELTGYQRVEELSAALLLAVREVDPAVAHVALEDTRDGDEHPVLAGWGQEPDGAAWRLLRERALHSAQLAVSRDRAAAAVPLVHGGQVLGLLRLHATSALPESALLAVASLALAAGGTLHAARLYARVLEESRRDALTGLHNRRRFEEDLQQELGMSDRDGRPVALLMLDVDHFKHYNDTHGHRQGDRLLHELSTLLDGALRGTDSAYRYGGEELAVLMRASSLEAGAALAERLRAVVASATAVTVSVGVAVAGPGTLADALVEAADRALYAAKSAGRNTVRTAAAETARRGLVAVAGA